MTNAFIHDHFFELLADALFEAREHAGEQARTKCTVCGKPARRAKCEACFAAYRAAHNKNLRNARKDKAPQECAAWDCSEDAVEGEEYCPACRAELGK